MYGRKSQSRPYGRRFENAVMTANNGRLTKRCTSNSPSNPQAR